MKVSKRAGRCLPTNLSSCRLLAEAEMRSTIQLGCCLLLASSLGLNAQESGGTQPSGDADQAPATQNLPPIPGTAQTAAAQNPATKAAGPSAQDLANQVNNPAAPV